MKKIFTAIILSLLSIIGCKSESKDLTALKEALGQPYQPVMKKSQKGNITSFNTTDENQQKALSIIINSVSTDITPWLKQHVGEYSPIYLYALAYRTAAIDKAPARDMFFWSSIANLRASADRALCKDKHVGQYLTILDMDFIRPSAAFYGEELKTLLQDENKIKEILKEAVEWDKNNPQKNSPVWFCNSGHGVFTSETYPQEEWEKRRADFKKEYIASIDK